MDTNNHPGTCSPQSTEPKTHCKYCGAQILQVTANRTVGYCMPHKRMGLSFVERTGGPIVLGEVSDLETARREFHQGHHAWRWEDYGDILSNHWQRFERSLLPGDVIRRFTGRLSAQNHQGLFAEKGFVIERGSCLVEGVCCKVGADPMKALENRAFSMAIAPKNGLEFVQLTLDEPDEEAVGGIDDFMQ